MSGDTLTIVKEASMEVRVYEAACGACGNDLNFEAKADRDGDILIKVSPCKGCIKDAVDEALAPSRAEADQ